MSRAQASPSSSASITVGPSEIPVTAGRLLRMFDSCRRELARAVEGVEGYGAGYDALRIHSDDLAMLTEDDVITVTAVVRSVQRCSHVVDYAASALTSEGGPVVLAQAHGWTIALGRPGG